jgi:hypothetical protein
MPKLFKPSVPGPTAGFIFFERKENEPKETLHLPAVAKGYGVASWWAFLLRGTSTSANVGGDKNVHASWIGNKDTLSSQSTVEISAELDQIFWCGGLPENSE